MHLIRTSAEIEAVCQALLDPELYPLLGNYAAALEEFGENLAATVLIVDPADTLDDIEHTYGQRLVVDSKFTFPVEVSAGHQHWFEIVWIQSDDGSGLVLLVHRDGDPVIVAACQHAVSHTA